MFDEAYVSEFPVAVAKIENRIAAFCTLWLSAGMNEVSVDLMRHRTDAPNGIVDILFVSVIKRAAEQGYR